MSQITEKACSRCKRILPIKKFYRYKGSKDGYSYQCRECRHANYLKRKQNTDMWPTYARAKISAHKARAREHGVASDFTFDDWMKILDASKGYCQYCGKYIGKKKLTIDHIVAMSVGGSNTVDNIAAACRSCNSAKNARGAESLVHSNISARLLDDWIAKLKEDFGSIQVAVETLVGQYVEENN